MLGTLIVLALSALEPNAIGPSSEELARAVAEFFGKSVTTDEIRELSCNVFDEEPTEARCAWEQRVRDKWIGFSTVLAIDGDGWHLIDEPIATDHN